MDNDDNFFQKLLAAGNSYWLTRFIILRLLGFVYAVAFLVAAQQLVPLIGGHGLTPANHFLATIQSQLGSSTKCMWRVPTLLWFGLSDNLLSTFSWIGFALSLVLAGYDVFEELVEQHRVHRVIGSLRGGFLFWFAQDASSSYTLLKGVGLRGRSANPDSVREWLPAEREGQKGSVNLVVVDERQLSLYYPAHPHQSQPQRAHGEETKGWTCPDFSDSE